MNNIEKKGVGWLSSKVADSKILEPFFNENDRTPSWDGSIFVYAGKAKKENLKDTIPIQIKSTEVDELHSERISYSLEISDIKNYYKIRGTILFVVEICGIERKGFIKSLLPSELKTILSELEEKDQQNKSIHLEELDTSNSLQLERKCEHFLIHRALQYSTIEYSLSITDASEIEIPFILDGTQIEEQLLSEEHLLYGKQANETVLRYIQNAKIESISQSLNRNVVTNSKIYFSQYSETRTPRGLFFEFGEMVRIDIQSTSTANLSYKLTGRLSEQIRVLNFLLDIFNTGEVYIGDGKLEITNIQNKDDLIEKVQKALDFLKDVEALLDYFNIDPNILEISLLGKRDFSIIKFLIDVILHQAKKQTTPFQLGFNGITIGNITLGILVYKNTDDLNFSVCNLFCKQNNLKFRASLGTENNFEVSMYVILKHEFLTLLNNLNLEVVLNDIKSITYSKGYGGATNLFGLELIKAYDVSKRSEFIDAAENIFFWLHQMDEDDIINYLNSLQILRRRRSFSKEEKTFLKDEQIKNKDNNRILCAINILLENKSDSELCFDLMTAEERDEFISYPIFTLGKQLNIF
jgi:hypothetical protein